MATIWPYRLPPEIESNVLRSAERRVYTALSLQLNEKWTVFYSRPWLGLSPTGEELDGEADFIAAHPDLGFITIEVKGGRIDYEPKTDRWTSTDRFGVTHPIKNPVAQARTAKYHILERLKESPHWRPRRLRIRHGVIFTDTEIPQRSYGLDMPRRIFCDRSELERGVAGWIESRFGDPESEDSSARPLGDDGMRALVKLLAEPFHFRVPLGNLIADDERDLEVLSQRQFQLLDHLEHVPRAAIRGAAGTGKTVLAAESARRLCERNFKVLLLCYNRALAFFLRQRVPSVPEISSFHSFCSRMAKEAGLQLPTGVKESELFETHLPELLARAADLLPDRRYDAIIVDEGQDFREIWWTAVDAWLVAGGRLQVFHDCNQQLYGDYTSLPRDISAVPILLNRNLRNTRAIHEVVMQHYRGEPVEPNDVAGSSPEIIRVNDLTTGQSHIVDVITRLIERERLPPEEITVLAATESLCRLAAPNDLLGRWVATACDERREGAIVIDTVRRFKGLESGTVILLITPELTREEELIYVATSRARAHLVIAGPPELTKFVMGSNG